LAHYAHLSFFFFGLLKGFLNSHKKQLSKAVRPLIFSNFRCAKIRRYNLIVPSFPTTPTTIEMLIISHIIVKADKTDTTVRYYTRVNGGLSEQQKTTKGSFGVKTYL
jgi:hypothetical protein